MKVSPHLLNAPLDQVDQPVDGVLQVFGAFVARTADAFTAGIRDDHEGAGLGGRRCRVFSRHGWSYVRRERGFTLEVLGR